MLHPMNEPGPLQAVREELSALMAELEATAVDASSRRVPDERRAALLNLKHYLCVRRHDLRPLQLHLSMLGLSSLNHLEPHVASGLSAVLQVARALLGEVTWTAPTEQPRIDDCYRLIEPHAEKLLGPHRSDRHVRIMVTMSAAQAADARGLGALMAAGMDVARINCAHDSPAEWRKLATTLRQVAQQQERSLRIAMDLGGPKLRTGAYWMPPDTRRLFRGDRLRLVRSTAAATACDASLAVASCSLPEALDSVRVGHRVLLKDGKLVGHVTSTDAEGIELEVTRVAEKGFKLKSDRGIHFPDSDLALTALTDADLACLPDVVKLADVVNLSFCQSGDDVRALREALRDLGRPDLGVVAKIETRQGFEALPGILEALMEGPAAGVMIARGDLAVEVGYERISEVQEEILWLCEAAHMPVIWATQVLESLAQDGIPSRAEITDAARGERAECVMLNKGPYVREAVQALDDILRRMEGHHSKKGSVLRPLRAFG